MTPAHLDRIVRETKDKNVLEALSTLPLSDLQSLLIEIYKRRAEKETPAKVLERYRNDRFVQPAAADPRDMADFDRIAFQIASEPDFGPFTPMELSPVAPLGAVSAVTNLSQNNVVTTTRNSEVVSDCTNVMALECAKRRAAEDRVSLCCSHRLVRTQPLTGPATFAHFRVFAMCTAGRDQGARQFEMETLTNHLRTFIRVLDVAKADGFGFKAIRITLTDFSGDCGDFISSVRSQVAEQSSSPEIVEDKKRTHAKNYYHPVAFGINIIDRSGVEHYVGDGGFTDWTQKLLSNKKERLLISALGSERFCFLFGKHQNSKP